MSINNLFDKSGELGDLVYHPVDSKIKPDDQKWLARTGADFAKLQKIVENSIPDLTQSNPNITPEKLTKIEQGVKTRYQLVGVTAKKQGLPGKAVSQIKNLFSSSLEKSYNRLTALISFYKDAL